MTSIVSSAASSVLSSAAASATPSSCSTADFTRIPTSDVACAVGSTQGIASNTSSVLESCCKTAPVESFNGDCGWYCLSVEQSVADLQSCFMEGGVSPSNIFCNANNSATATGRPEQTSSSASGTRSASSTTGTSSAETSRGAAPAVLAPQGVSKAGLGMLAMVVVSAFAGAFL